MAHVMDPSVLLGIIDFQNAAPVIGNHRQRVTIWHFFVIMNNNFNVFSRYSIIHKDVHKGIDRISAVINIIHKHNLISWTKICRWISPAVNIDTRRTLSDVSIGTCYDSSIKDWVAVFSDQLIIFAYDIGHVSTAAKGTIDYIRNKIIFIVHFVSKL